MREKILSLAKGNFIYETPKLCLSIEKLVFEVTAGRQAFFWKILSAQE